MFNGVGDNLLLNRRIPSELLENLLTFWHTNTKLGKSLGISDQLKLGCIVSKSNTIGLEVGILQKYYKMTDSVRLKVFILKLDVKLDIEENRKTPASY